MTATDLPRYPFPCQDVPVDGHRPTDPMGLSALYNGLAPVTRVRLPEGHEAFLVTGHADCLRVLREHDTFRRAGADAIPPYPRTSPTMLARDGREHRVHRDLVANAFAPARIDRYRPSVERLTSRLLDALVQAGDPIEVNEQLAMPLTLGVIGGAMGLPEDDLPLFRTWGDMFLSTGADHAAENERAMLEMSAYMAGRLGGLMADAEPGPEEADLLAVIAGNAVRRQTGLEEAALLAASVVIAGWETTAAAIAGHLFRLLTTREDGGDTLYRLLAAHPHHIPRAVEELLRTTPGTVFESAQPRRAVREVELGGVRLREGDLVIPAIERANRDPDVFEDPEHIDFRRAQNSHLAFGSGPHVCLGAPLARLELAVVLRELTRRFPAARLHHAPHDVVWNTGTSIRHPAALCLDLAAPERGPVTVS
ncbi:cytochrome P450 [Actinomadura mexicana]|uniref:Cytochrome P450 n=1 Tax=Actinomadura mexicana TaxID=134959 RepID=A0A239FJ12_9ACTN|nr:cytochrome P450 [Actinomadura mexicana]SNS56899.1 Cytochrome P450 [Actinomadura mexicana]